MRWVPLAIVLAAVSALSACGGNSSKTASGSESSSTTAKQLLPPAQYENLQRIEGYVLAIKRMSAPFEDPLSGPTNHAKATQLSRTAVAEFGAVTPPPQFKAAHEKALAALRAEVAIVREFESAQRTHNATGISNAQAKNVRDSEEVRAAVKEIAVELRRCRQDSFKC